MTAIRRYTFRLYPNAAQTEAMFETRFLICQLYNALVEQRRDAWDRRRISLTKFTQGRECTLLRNSDDRYRAMGSAIMERCCERVDQAFKKYFDNVKAWRRGQWSKPFPPSPPRYQRTRDFSGFGFREEPRGWKFAGDRVRMQSIPGWVRIGGRFPADPMSIRTCDVMYRDEKWQISIVVNLPDDAAMRAATGRFSNVQPSNIPYLTRLYDGIPGGEPSIEGVGQATAKCGWWQFSGGEPSSERIAQAEIALDLVSAFGWLVDETGQYAISIEPAKARKGPRGARNRTRRQALAIRRRDYAMHELTTALAVRYSKIVVNRPRLREITASGAGDAKNHGAMVEWKAAFNRSVLDYGAGKFCELLSYKMKQFGHEIVVNEVESTRAATPARIVDVAKVSKKVRRVAKRAGKAAIRVATHRNFPGQASNHPTVAVACAHTPSRETANVG